MRFIQIIAAGLLFHCLFLISNSLTAQDYRPGYIIKNNSDSVRGYVRYMGRKNGKRCDFKTSRKSGRTTFDPSELLRYAFTDGQIYTTVTLPGTGKKEKVFARILAKGPLTLYSYKKTFYIKTDSLIQLPVPKKKIVDPVEQGGNQMEKKDKRYVSILNQILVDCQMTADDASYAEGDLTKLVKNYNRCKGANVDYMKPKPLYRLNAGAMAGYVSSELIVKESAYVPFDPANTTIDPSKTVIGGISLDISSPRVYDKFFITVEGWYFKSTYIGSDYKGTTYQDVTIDVNAIRFFLGFKYNFLSETSTPFIKAGFSHSISQKMDVKSTLELQNSAGQVFYYDDPTGLTVEKNARGFWFSAGYSHLIVKKAKAFVEFRYERAKGYFGNPVMNAQPEDSFRSQLNNYSILAGIRF